MIVFTVRSTRLFSVVKIFVYGMKILGLAAFRVRIKSPAQISPANSRVEVFHYSKIGLAYNVLLLVPVLFVAMVDLCPASPVDPARRTVSQIVSHSIGRANVFLINLAACLILITWGIRQEAAASVMNQLLEVDLELAGFEERPFDKLALLSAAVHVSLTACCWASYSTWHIFYHDDNYCLYSTVSFCLPRAIVFWFITEYYIVVGLAANDVQAVNKYLSNFKETESHLFPPAFRRGRVSTGQDLAYRKLLHYRAIRTRLSRLCGDIGEFFSLPILFCVACSFTAHFHSLFRTFWYYRDDKQAPAAQTAVWIMMDVLLYAYPIVALALNVTRIGKEARLTKRIVDGLSEAAIRREIISELESFSRQLMREEVSFTAYGFFSLDSSLLLSMLGGTITYCVALMQLPNKNCPRAYQGNSTTLLHPA